MLLNNKKISLILPLYYDNRFITDFKEKAELFNLSFSKQSALISSNSSIHNYINYTTEKRLSTVAHSVEAIDKIIQNLDSNKAHGHDNISICMLKICGDSIYEPLEIIFRQLFLLAFYRLNGKRQHYSCPQKK